MASKYNVYRCLFSETEMSQRKLKNKNAVIKPVKETNDRVRVNLTTFSRSGLCFEARAPDLRLWGRGRHKQGGGMC